MQVQDLFKKTEKTLTERRRLNPDEKTDEPRLPEDTISSWKKNIETDMDVPKAMALQSVVESCLGVLLSIKQNGEMSLTDNKFIRELGNKIYEDHPEDFYEINNTLLHLSNKVEP